MFMFQESLPKLPVPKLDDTLKKCVCFGVIFARRVAGELHVPMVQVRVFCITLT